MRAQFTYRPELRANFFQFRLRSGEWVPVCVQSKVGTLGIIPILTTTPVGLERSSANAFRKAFPGAKVFFVSPESVGIFQALSDHEAIIEKSALA